MLKLLKLYSLDYLKKSLFSITGAFFFGLVVLYPFTDSTQDRLLFVNWSCYLAIYGLFVYIYPLPNLVKWSMNLPVSKRELIAFNVVLQMVKMIISIGLMILVVWIEVKSFPDTLWIEKWSGIAGESKMMMDAGSSSFFRGPIGSTEVMLIFMSMTFALAFLFNVSPYEMFKGKNRPSEQWQSWLLFLWKKKRREVFSFLSIVAVLLLMRSVYYSKAFLGAFSISVGFLLVYFTYYRTLILDNRSVKAAGLIAGVMFVFLWTRFLSYSRSLTAQNDLNIESKIKEYEFQGIDLSGDDPEKLKALILSNDLCPRDMKKLMNLAAKSGQTFKANKIKWKDTAFPVIRHNLGQLDFHKFVLERDTPCSLRSGLGLFSPGSISPQMAMAFMEKWLLVSLPDPHMEENLIERMVPVSFTRDDIEKLFNKDHRLFHMLALKIFEQKNHDFASELITANIHRLDNQSLFLAAGILGKYSCRSHDIRELISSKLSVEDFSPVSCHRRRRQRTISSLESGPFRRTKRLER